MIRNALQAVAAAGVPFAFRGDQPLDGPPPGGDIDILVGSHHLARADRALQSTGFRRLRTVGHRGHRFYLAFRQGRWIKIDINVVPRRLGWDLSATDPEHRALFSGYRIRPPGRTVASARIRAAWARRRPLGVRRRGAVIALLGPDGAGKGSVADALEKEIPIAISRVYLGEGGSANVREGGSANGDGGARPVAHVDGARRRPGALREAQHLARKAVRSCWRVLWPGYARAWRGEIVIFDRHPIEVLAVRPRRTWLGRAVERTLARRLIPWPDAVVVLDAPGHVLYARKGEHSPEILERWRRGYLDEFTPRGATVVSTLGGLERAVGETSAVVWEALRRRRGW
jgi:thymidylate kinase